MNTMQRLTFLSLSLLLPGALGAQTFLGGEIVVHQSPTHGQGLGDVAVTADGGFVLTWVEGSTGTDGRVLIRRYDAAGQPLGRAFAASVPQAGGQSVPRLALGADGRFVVAWQAGDEVWLRLFDAQGRANQPRFRVFDAPTEGRSGPDVAVAPDGRFLVAWSEIHGLASDGGPRLEIWGRWFDANAIPLATPFVVANTAFDYEATSPRIAFNAQGGFVIAFEALSENTSSDIQLQRYFADGRPRGPQVVVHEVDPGNPHVQQSQPAVLLADEGHSFVVYGDKGADPGSPEDPALPSLGVQARTMRTNSTPAGAPIRVSSTLPGAQFEPTLAPTPDGGYLVVWTSSGGQDGDGTGLFLRRFGRFGDAVTAELPGGPVITRGNQRTPGVALNAAGRGVIGWSSSPSTTRNTHALVVRRLAVP